MLVALIVAATEATDELMKERDIANAEQTLQFYQSKILTSRSREHREALAKLISAEDQKLMLASEGRHFVAEPLACARISIDPTSMVSVWPMCRHQARAGWPMPSARSIRRPHKPSWILL